MLLQIGMSGPDVQNLQLILQGLGFKGFEATGKYDEKTSNVIKYIQKSHIDKLADKLIDGRAGTNTLNLIDELYQPEIKNFAPKETPIVQPLPSGEFPKGDEELATVHPILAKRVMQVIDLAFEEKDSLTTVQGRRTFAEQDALFKKRPRVTKARGGQSYHNYGVAVDIAFIVNGKIDWTDSLYRDVGRWAARVGLEWGGNWRFVDMPHLQLNNMPATGTLLAEYNRAGGGDAGVKAVWKKFVS